MIYIEESAIFIKVLHSRYKEWTEQLNIYGYLYRKAGFPVEKLQIIAIFRDWSKSKAKYEKNYPKQIETINLKVWTDEEVETFIKERIRLFEMALTMPDDDIPPCLPEERWQTIKWAVVKPGGKRAVKLFDDKAGAQEYLRQAKRPELEIEHRESDPIRCLEYCRCNNYCNYYRDHVAKLEKSA